MYMTSPTKFYYVIQIIFPTFVLVTGARSPPPKLR